MSAGFRAWLAGRAARRRVVLLLSALCLAAVGCERSAAGQGTSGAARKVRVAAASDLKFALAELGAEFRAAHPGIELEVSYGSSGNFYAQLGQRAPFDVFFSADVAYPERLIQAGLGARDTLFVYGIGRIVVWVPAGSDVDPARLGLRTLADPAVRKIAIANPEHAPYGRAAIAALQKLGVYAEVKDKLVLGENVSQAAQFVESGSADAGVIALSLALSSPLKGKGRYWEVPLDAYPRLEQAGVVLPWARDPEAARALRSFVLGGAGRATLRRFGFYDTSGPAPAH